MQEAVQPEPSEAAASSPDSTTGGADLVQAALGRAKAAAAAKGLRPGRPGRVRRTRRGQPGELSGARPDGRDPQTFTSSMDRLVTELGWQQPVAIGGAMGRWDSIVGQQVAQHAQPQSFEDGVLTIQADSTAWASQLRLLAPRLLAQIAGELGDGVVTRLLINGPAGPARSKGRIRVSDGRGPRDTYG